MKHTPLPVLIALPFLIGAYVATVQAAPTIIEEGEDEPPSTSEQSGPVAPTPSGTEGSPDPAPEPPKTSWTVTEVDELIRRYADEYGANYRLARTIAHCESGLRFDAKNPGSTASGVFQYIRGTWANTPEGKAGESVFNAEANVKAAVRHLAKKGTSPWNESKHCWGGTQ